MRGTDIDIFNLKPIESETPPQQKSPDHDPYFKPVKSKCSCNIREINSFIFCGLSSRFWLQRKHIISMSEQEIGDIPFYSWQCLTLNLEHRDVDLVIYDEKDMQIFLRFLIQSLETIDGNRNTSEGILKTLNE